MPRQARSLDVLLAEVNAHAPKRSKVSDGGLGDQAHAARTSDHNPNAAGVWTARDFTHDPTHGLDCNDLARRLVATFGKHPAMKSGSYVIWNGRIYSYNRRTEGWRTYTGANQHTKHLHLSVSDAAVGYDSTQHWNLWKIPAAPREQPALTALHNDWINARVIPWHNFDAVIRSGNQPSATAAKKARDAIQTAMRAFIEETN